MNAYLSNRSIVRVLYRETTPPTPDALACTVCGRVIKQKKGSGYKNLVTHLKLHPGYEDAALAAIEQKGDAKPAVAFFNDKGANATFRWLELIVKKNLPLTFVGDEIVRRSVKFDSLSYNTFVQRFNRTAEMVRDRVADDLKDKRFALVFDGFTEGAEHFLGVFAAYDGRMRFLTFSQFEDDSSMTADEHIEFLDKLLDDFGLDAANLMCIVSDNMSTNRAISKKTNIPIVGCASHRLSLAVRDWLKASGSIELLKRTSRLMRKLRSVKHSAKLNEKGCKVKPMVLHELRWMGYYDLLSRYIKLRPYLHLFEEDVQPDRANGDDRDGDSSGDGGDASDAGSDSDDADDPDTVVALIPSSFEHATLKQLFEEMGSIAYVTKALQSPRERSLSDRHTSTKGKGKKKRSADDIHDMLKSKRLKIAESGSRMSTRTLDNLLLLKLNWDLVDVSVVSGAIKSLQQQCHVDSDSESDASDVADFSNGFSDTE